MASQESIAKFTLEFMAFLVSTLEVQSQHHLHDKSEFTSIADSDFILVVKSKVK